MGLQPATAAFAGFGLQRFMALYCNAPRRLVAEGVAAAVVEVGGFVFGDEFDHAGPEPGWGVEGLGTVASEFAGPLLSGGGGHLTAVGFAEDCGEVAGRADGLLAGEGFHLELEVLRHEFAEDDGTAE